ncbi:MAG TPA: M48 family metalloprotease [Spirochaetia bacterium]|nr:M48 family metalloprotease [Spirochaetia bacterium]
MALVWLFNWLVVSGMLVLVGNQPPVAAGLVALVLLGALTLLAASRSFERLTAWFMGARRPTRQEMSSVSGALALIGQRLGGAYQPDVLVLDRPLPQAWALGRETVVVTAGLLGFCRDGELAGVLAHEAGHQLEGHAVRRMILRMLGLSGGLAGVLGWSAVRLGLALGRTGRRNPVWETAAWLSGVLACGVRLVDLAEKAVCAALFRREEYGADAFAARLGLGEGLSSYLGRLAFLDQLGSAPGWQRLWLAHPPYHLRLERLRHLS